MNDKSMSMSEIKQKLTAISKLNPNVFLKADKDVPYGFVVQVMSDIKEAGIEKLGMITEPKINIEGKWKEPSLPATALFSFLLHVTFIFTALITIKNANHFTLPSAYIVSLVSTEVSGQPARGKEGTASQIEEPEQK